jgi:hypothetical protein
MSYIVWNVTRHNAEAGGPYPSLEACLAEIAVMLEARALVSDDTDELVPVAGSFSVTPFRKAPAPLRHPRP